MNVVKEKKVVNEFCIDPFKLKNSYAKKKRES